MMSSLVPMAEPALFSSFRRTEAEAPTKAVSSRGVIRSFRIDLNLALCGKEASGKPPNWAQMRARPNVRFGSFTTENRRLRHVRLFSDSDRGTDVNQGSRTHQTGRHRMLGPHPHRLAKKSCRPSMPGMRRARCFARWRTMSSSGEIREVIQVLPEDIPTLWPPLSEAAVRFADAASCAVFQGPQRVLDKRQRDCKTGPHNQNNGGNDEYRSSSADLAGACVRTA